MTFLVSLCAADEDVPSLSSGAFSVVTLGIQNAVFVYAVVVKNMNFGLKRRQEMGNGSPLEIVQTLSPETLSQMWILPSDEPTSTYRPSGVKHASRGTFFGFANPYKQKKLANQSINQPINQSINPSNNRPNNQSIIQRIDRSINQSIH